MEQITTNLSLSSAPFLKACRLEKTTRTPLWLMRQAGRYMKEYRQIREKVPFLELCKNSDLCAQITVEAAHKLGVDAAIQFSDLLVILEPLGFTLSYEKNEGPVIGNPFRNKSELKRMAAVKVEASLGYVFEAIRKTSAALKKDLPLIGFVGAPFTLASYVLEGGRTRDFSKTKTLMRKDPETWDALLSHLVDATLEYARGQSEAGVQAIQVFDSWVGALSPEEFRTSVLPHSKRLIDGMPKGIPVIHFGTGTGPFLSLFKQAGGDVIGLDSNVNLREAWRQCGDVAIQGNLAPEVLLGTEDEIRLNVRRILEEAGGKPGHIFNLGHGVLPQTSVDKVIYLVETVKELSQR